MMDSSNLDFGLVEASALFTSDRHLTIFNQRIVQLKVDVRLDNPAGSILPIKRPIGINPLFLFDKYLDLSKTRSYNSSIIFIHDDNSIWRTLL